MQSNGSWTPPVKPGQEAPMSGGAGNPQAGKFPTMGTTVADSVSAVSGQPKLSVKKNNAKGGFLESATAAHKANIQERLGAQLTPSANIVYPNSPESSLTQRNVTLVPSSVGNRDFWDKRKYGQGL
jgi:hypothetical protein